MNAESGPVPDSDSTVAARPAPGMVWIPGGRFQMGSDHHYPEEAPAHPVRLDGFWMDASPVTNAQFRHFVDATGYVTFCETAPDPSQYPGADPGMLAAASVVFVPPPHEVDLRDPYRWWHFITGANWRHPQGPDSSIDGLDDHPVVHVAFADVEAYAIWAGKQIATEAEWEWAARGGGVESEYAWGSELVPDGKYLANTWQGEFPWQNLAQDGHVGTSPVGAYPSNPYGLWDMIGNVWEWTCDWYGRAHPQAAQTACCIPSNPRGPSLDGSFDPAQPAIRIPRRVMKGGSHLCAPNYCRRYRPAARMAQPVDTSTSHLGFRCIVRATAPGA